MDITFYKFEIPELDMNSKVLEISILQKFRSDRISLPMALHLYSTINETLKQRRVLHRPFAETAFYA